MSLRKIHNSIRCMECGRDAPHACIYLQISRFLSLRVCCTGMEWTDIRGGNVRRHLGLFAYLTERLQSLYKVDVCASRAHRAFASDTDMQVIHSHIALFFCMAQVQLKLLAARLKTMKHLSMGLRFES